MDRLVVVLGVCATLVTLGAWASALLPDGSGGGQAGAAAPDQQWQVVTRASGSFAVPRAGAGWTVGGADEVLYYADRRGRPVVEVRGPAVLDDGYCAGAKGPSNRAFAGLTGPVAGQPPRTVAVRLSESWAAAVGRAPTVVRPREVVLGDGSSAVHVRAVVRLEDDGPCRPERVGLDHLSRQTPAGVVTLVLVRDLGGPHTLPDSVAARILHTLRAPAGRSRSRLRACAGARSVPSGRGPCAGRGWRASGSGGCSRRGWGR